MSREDRDRVLAQELETHRNDAGEWEEDAETITVRPSRTTVVSCRFPVEEMRALEQAARMVGESISEYVRKAVLMRQSGGMAGAFIQATTGSFGVQIRTSAPLTSQWSEAPSTSGQNIPSLAGVK